ncbi:MAG: hypothetical protein PVG77_04745 [Nitrosopumilaceae archaeon]
MKAVFLLLVLVTSLAMPSTFGQEPNNFGYKIMPEKLVVGTEGILQVYGLSKNIPIPKPIDDLIVVSSDQNIVKILELTINQETAITTVKLKAIGAGTTSLALAAPGFASEEFPITVYGIKQGGQKLLVKAVPDTFTINGPTKGYFSVELADIDSNPTFANRDIPISITTSNSEIVSLHQDEITIKEGEYFTTGEFDVKKPGDVSIYAESQNIDPGNSKIKVLGISEDNNDDEKNEENYKIQLYVIPEKISNFATSSTYAIVQLQGSDGSPIKATESIPVSLNIDYDEPVFNDRKNTEISTADSLVIPPGSTTGYVKLSVKAGVQETYKVSISAEDYLVSDSVEFKTVLTPDVDEPLTKLQTIPMLASGDEQLIGVLYPSDTHGVALINLKTVESEINSSNRDALTISDDRMETGSGAKLIYGKLGTTKPDILEITIFGEEKETVVPTVFGPEKNELKLVSEPLVSKIMPKTSFPMMAYLIDEDNASWYFPDTSNVVMSPSEYIKTSVETVSEGQSIALLSSQSLKEGKVNLEFQANEYTSTFDLNAESPKPKEIELTFPDHLLSGMKNTLSLQIQDSNGNPLFANKDTEFRIAADDNTVEIPHTVTIKKGEHVSFFDIIPKQAVETEISVLASDFPLSKFSINTVETTPTLIISTVNSIPVGEVFDLVLDAKLLDFPLSNVKVNWDIQGAEIQKISEITDGNGKIKVTLVSKDTENIIIKATTNEFDQISVTKEISIQKPGETPQIVSEHEENIVENNLGFILIPGVVIGSGILLRKRSLLEPLAERVPAIENALDRIDEIFERLEFSEKIEAIKEKIPIIKER